MMRLLLITLLLALPFTSRTQCPGAVLRTQADLDNWVANWYTCTTLNGSLYLGGSDIYDQSDIQDLSGLSFLTSIDGALRIEYCPNLTSLAGLENVIGISEELWLIELHKLSSLDGLSGLQSLFTDPAPLWQVLIIEGCNTLENLEGLEGLSEINAPVRISYNDKLKNLMGLQNVGEINGDLRIDGNVELTDISALSGITGPLNNLWLRDNSALQNVNGLEGVTEIIGECIITYGNALNHLNGLSGITSIGKDFEVRNNFIGDMSGLESLTYVGRALRIEDNQNMVSVDGLNNLTTVAQNLSIENNNLLNSLTGLSSLQTVGGDMYLNNLHGLENLSGLESLNSIAGSMWISENNALTSLLGMENISSIGGTLGISSHPLLTDCAVASVCNHIDMGGDIFVWNNQVGCADEEELINACAGSPCASFAITPMAQHTTCGFDNGIAWVTVAGATSPITYQWANGATTAGIDDLAPGMYIVTVTDAQGCSAIQTIQVNASNGFQISPVMQDAICADTCDGIADVTGITGGTSPFVYSWSHGATDAMLDDLCAGVYTVMVTDAAGCMNTATITIQAPESIVIVVDEITDLQDGNPGAVHITVSGGTSTYVYSWTGPAGFSSSLEDIIDLQVAGCYEVNVTDNNGCVAVMANICVDESTTSVNDLAQAGIKIYPNPARDVIFIAPRSIQRPYFVGLYDLDGVMLFGADNVHFLDVSGFESGLYVIKVQTNSGHLVKPVVVIR